MSKRKQTAYEDYSCELLNGLGLGEVYLKRDGPCVFFNDMETRKYLQRFYLHIDAGAEDLILDFYPADITSQGKEFYKRAEPASVMRLAKLGWKIRTNFHCAYQGSLLVYPNTGLTVEEYLTYWANNQQRIRQYKRNEFDMLYDQMLRDRLIQEKDLEELWKNFDNTKRDHLNICPGLMITYRLPSAEVEEPKNRGRLLETLKKLVSEVVNLGR